MSELQARRRDVVGEGSVVLVAGKLDERVRKASGDAVYGTIIWTHGNECAVLLADGDIWMGRLSEVFEQTPTSKET